MSEEELTDDMPQDVPSSTPVESRGGKRHANRVLAMQFFYMWEANRHEHWKDLLLGLLESQEKPRDYFAFAEDLIHGALANMEEIDEKIKSLAQNWKFDRIARVDLAILRMACFELLYRRDIPPVVTINEALNLGKKYSNDESRRFINGLLDRLTSSLNRPLREADNT